MGQEALNADGGAAARIAEDLDSDPAEAIFALSRSPVTVAVLKATGLGKAVRVAASLFTQGRRIGGR